MDWQTLGIVAAFSSAVAAAMTLGIRWLEMYRRPRVELVLGGRRLNLPTYRVYVTNRSFSPLLVLQIGIVVADGEMVPLDLQEDVGRRYESSPRSPHGSRFNLRTGATVAGRTHVYGEQTMNWLAKKVSNGRDGVVAVRPYCFDGLGTMRKGRSWDFDLKTRRFTPGRRRLRVRSPFALEWPTGDR